MSAAATMRAPWPATLGAAVYLACSWTWCIGMFLPVLLLRDYGAWGFVVFAIPNVIGAGAFAWVLLRPGASTKLLTRHKPVVLAFSAVTIAYQLFFLGWMTRWAEGKGYLIAAVLAAIAGALCTWARRGWLLFAIAVYGLSLFTIFRNLDAEGLAIPSEEPVSLAILWIAPVTLFGFALCPYLDPTFHRVRQRLGPPASLIAFGLGFGVFFLAMLLYAAAYGSTMDAFQQTAIVGSGPRALILVHIAAQLGFTVTAHVERMVTSIVPSHRTQMAGLVAMAVVLAAAAIAPLSAPWEAHFRGMSWGELIYRLFLAFYGLLFPAYVWLCVIPTRDGHSGIVSHLGRRKRNIWLAAVGIAAPMFWMGFIERREPYLPLGILVVLLARLALPRGQRRSQ